MLHRIKHKESIIVFLIGIVVFGLLNYLMLHMNYDIWTSTKFGAYTAFHKGWELSGFDNTTYIAVSTGRPLYSMMRHPLIMYFVWPMWQLNELLRSSLHMNCAIHIVACVWTVISAFSLTILYRILRSVMNLTVMISALLCLFYYSFAHIMLATFAPDHMIISMTLLLLMLYVSAKAVQEGRRVSTWKSLLLCLLSTGIATTNCIKIWLVDMCSMQGGVRLKDIKWWQTFVAHSLCYLIPLLVVGGLYYNMQESFADEGRFAEKMDERLKEKNPKFATEKFARIARIKKENESKQLFGGELFQWTDFSIPIGQSVVENFFGEGFLLHEEFTLRDSNKEGHRPTIVGYSHWYDYLVEACVVLLFMTGVWLGRRQRLMWMALSIFIFDCALHLGLRFALSDVYIMTAHWAFIVPIATGYTLLRLRNQKRLQASLITLIAIITAFLWYHNLTLIYEFIV